MKSISIQDTSKKLSAEVQKALWTLGLHAFSLILFFVFIGLIFGANVFLKYVFTAETAVPTVSGSIVKFNVQTYQSVLKELQARNQDAE